MKIGHWILVVLLGLTLLAGCGGESGEPEPAYECQGVIVGEGLACERDGITYCVDHDISRGGPYTCEMFTCGAGKWGNKKYKGNSCWGDAVCSCYNMVFDVGGD